MRIDMLNLPKEYIGLAKRLGLEFKLGEILEARVLKAEAARALLLLKGQKILADVKTNLQPGDSIKVRVTGEFQNQVVLKVLSDSPQSTSPAEQMLRQAGFTPNNETRAALAFLLKNGLPVTPGTVQTILTDQAKTLDQIMMKLFVPGNTPEANTTPGKEPSGLQSLFKGLAQGKTELLGMFKQAAGHSAQTAEPTKPGENTTLPKQVAAEPKTAGEPKSTSPAGQPQTDTTQRTVPGHTGPQQPIQIKTPEPGVTATPKPALSRQEASVLKATVDQQTSAALTTESSDKRTPAQVKVIASTPANQDTPVSNNTSTVKVSQTETQTRLPVLQTLARLEQNGLALNPARNLPELVRGLKLLMQNFDLSRNTSTAAPIEGGKPDLTSLLSTPLTETQTEAVRDLSDKMLAMRLHHKEPGVLLHMEIPLIFNQQLRTGVLQIRGDEDSQTLAVEDRPLSILFRLETEDLGQLRVMVLLRDTEVNCQFAADREETRQLLRQSVPDLKTRFEAMSYQVSHMGISTLSEEEVEKAGPLPGQVDFRV